MKNTGVLFLLFVFTIQLFSQNIDKSFGQNSYFSYSDATLEKETDDYPRFDLIPMSNNKFLVFTRETIVCVDADGKIDKTFGSNGIIKFPSRDDKPISPRCGVVQKDGKILIAGSCGSTYTPSSLILRYNPNGTIDKTFGENGFFVEKLNVVMQDFEVIAILPDNKILLSTNEALVKVGLDGKKDKSFGNNGVVTMSEISEKIAFISDMCALSDGNILIAAHNNKTDKGYSLYFKLGKDGIINKKFGTDGCVKIGTSAQYGTYTIATNNNSFITWTENAKSLYACNTMGEFDEKFNSYGKKELKKEKIDYDIQISNAITFDEKDNMLITGIGKNIPNISADMLTICRMYYSGDMDSTFGTNGIMNIVSVMNTKYHKSYSMGNYLLIAGKVLNEGKYKIFVQKVLLQPMPTQKIKPKIEFKHEALAILKNKNSPEEEVILQEQKNKKLRTANFLNDYDIDTYLYLERYYGGDYNNFIGMDTYCYQTHEIEVLRDVMIYDMSAIYSKKQNYASISNFELFHKGIQNKEYVLFYLIDRKPIMSQSFVAKQSVTNISKYLYPYKNKYDDRLEDIAPFFIVTKEKAQAIMQYYYPSLTQTIITEDGKSFYSHISNPNFLLVKANNKVYLSYDLDSTTAKIVCFNNEFEKEYDLIIVKDYPLYCGFTVDENENIYLIVSKNNKDGDFSSNLRLCKYNSKGEKIANFNLPTDKQNFDFLRFAGGCRVLYEQGKIAIHMSKDQHKHGDGLNHQWSIFFVVDVNTMALINDFSSTWCASHSFGQRLIYDGSNFVYADLGDGYPRGIQITKGKSNSQNRKVVFTYKTALSQTEKNPAGRAIGVGKWSNDNNCYTSLGGLSISSKGYVIMGCSEKSFDNDSLKDNKNLFWVHIDKDFDKKEQTGCMVSPEVVISKGANSKVISYYGFGGEIFKQQRIGVVWLTNYKYRENKSVILPHIICIGLDKYLVVYGVAEVDNYFARGGVKYMVVNAEGKILVTPQNIGLDNNSLKQDGELLLVGSKVIWAVGKGDKITLNILDIEKI